MKAVIIHAAKDLRVEEREVRAPEAGQVTIAIGAGGIFTNSFTRGSLPKYAGLYCEI